MPLHKLRRTAANVQRRASYDSTFEIEDASNAVQSTAVTIPADAKLVLVMFGARWSADAAGTHTVTLGGSSPDYTPLAFNQNTNRNGIAAYGFLTSNTGTGSQTWVSSFSGNSGISAQVTFFFFSAGNYNTANPFGTGQLQEDTSSGTPIRITHDPVSDFPLIVAQCSISQSSGSGMSWTNINLTNVHDFNDSNNCYATGYNNSLEKPGSTVFEFDNTNWTSSYSSMSLVEVLSVGYVP